MPKNVPEEDKKNINSRFTSIFNPFSTQRLTLFTLLAGGDPEKEKRLILINAQVIQLVCLATIPLAILALTVILPWRGFIPTYADVTVITFTLYIAGLLFAFLGYKWHRIIKWHFFYNTYDMGMLISHSFRTGICFILMIMLFFFLGTAGPNILTLMPMFIFEAVMLILTFPTQKRWVMWEQEFR